MSNLSPKQVSPENSSESPEVRSEFEAIWALFSTSSTSSCQPNDPPDGASKEPFIEESEVPDTGGQHVKGEEYACGEWRGQKHAPCGTVTVTVAAGKTIVAVRRFAKETFNNIWHPDPCATMGWCDWVELSNVSLPDGRTFVSTTLKNWSHDRPRRIRLEVWIK